MEKNLGHATAYGYAKSKGYSGTEEEFAVLMADYASVGQSAAQSAEQAAASATSASGSAATASQAAQTATSKASEAVTAADTATTKASEASQSASTASAAATSASTNAQTATTAAATATAKAIEANESATTATTAKTDAETARDAAAQSASQAAESARTLTIDATLTQSGQAADAKAVGDKIDSLKSDLNVIVSNNTATISLNDLTYVQQGVIQGGTGAFVSPSSASHKIVKMDASNLTYIAFKSNTPYTNSVAFGVIKDSSDNVVKVFNFDNTTNMQEYTLTPSNGDTLYVSFLNYATVPNPNYSTFDAKNYPSIVDSYADDIEGLVEPIIESAINNNLDAVKYYDCIKKPFAFANKKLWFFGDSITYGYIGASGGVPAHQASNQYPKLFSEAVEAQSYVNWGVSGSTLADTYTTISTHPLSCDFIFVAGGVNDWQTGVNETAFIETVTNICEHLKNNFSGEVIFITPINEAGRVPITTPAQTLQNVRNVITRIALQYGYSVVQGWTFPFPTKWDANDYINAIFQDKLHPTELGYSMYAQALRGALC